MLRVAWLASEARSVSGCDSRSGADEAVDVHLASLAETVAVRRGEVVSDPGR